MLREEAKSKIRMGVTVNKDYIKSLEKADEVIDKIYDEHETQLKAKDEEIERLKAEKDSLCKTIKDLQTANTHWRIYHKDNA